MSLSLIFLLHFVSSKSNRFERETGIEPASPVWKTGVLPLNHSRKRLMFDVARISLAENLYRIYGAGVGTRTINQDFESQDKGNRC